MQDTAGSFVFRPSTPEDLAFLLDSWARSYLQGSGAHKLVSPDEFHRCHRPIRERFFAKPNTCVIVCTPDSDPWLIIGWIGVEQIPSGLILQYIYVRSTFKGQGIAKQLVKRALPTAPVFYTHLTRHAAEIMSKKPEHYQGYKHVPHLV